MGLREWREDTLKSRGKFIWRAGVLMAGTLFGLAMATWYVFLTPDAANYTPREKTLASLAIIFVAGPVFGLLWGWLMWRMRGSWHKPPPDTE
jgi:hypothetical protein